MENKLFRELAGKRVECLACNWYCKIPEGQTGVCGVRANVDGKLKLLVYGKTTGVAVDPIEKKPFYHFLPGSTALSFGTYGCDFGCIFCQNWQISQATKILKKEKGFNLLQTQDFIDKTSYSYLPEDIVEEAIKQSSKTVAYTYNEPAVFVEYAFECMKLAKKKKLKNVFVSNGYESKESFELIKDYLDGINIDLKGATENFYREYCKAKLEPVLVSIERFWKAGIWVEVTTMLIEGANDSEKDLRWIARFLKKISPDIPWHLSQMHPDFKMGDGKITSFERLKRAYEIGKEEGLSYIYAYSPSTLLGTSPYEKSELNNTFCPKCGEMLIKRRFFESEIVGMKNGKCKKCGEMIAGVWS